jgi:Ca2+-binding EF-hand superfamily protein
MLTKDIDWDRIREHLPTDKSPESVEKRKKLFSYIDGNGNGYLSLAEIDKGVRDALKLPEVFELKPVLMRAYQAAKNFKPSKNKVGEDYVEKSEFKFLLVCLRQYLEYYVMFDRIDSSDDKKISVSEFKLAVPTLEKWGIKVSDPEATFASIDTNGGGSILFDEFCHWAIKQNLDLDDDDDYQDEDIKSMK